MKAYITKKQVKEAPEFMVAIDYLAGQAPAHVKYWEYEMLGASTILEAMAETEMFFTDKVYMIHLLQKTGKLCCGGESIEYKAVMAIRNKYGNFHLHDEKHGEREFRTCYDPNSPVGYQMDYLPDDKYSEKANDL